MQVLFLFSNGIAKGRAIFISALMLCDCSGRGVRVAACAEYKQVQAFSKRIFVII